MNEENKEYDINVLDVAAACEIDPEGDVFQQSCNAAIFRNALISEISEMNKKQIFAIWMTRNLLSSMCRIILQSIQR